MAAFYFVMTQSAAEGSLMLLHSQLVLVTSFIPRMPHASSHWEITSLSTLHVDSIIPKPMTQQMKSVILDIVEPIVCIKILSAISGSFTISLIPKVLASFTTIL